MRRKVTPEAGASVGVQPVSEFPARVEERGGCQGRGNGLAGAPKQGGGLDPRLASPQRARCWGGKGRARSPKALPRADARRQAVTAPGPPRVLPPPAAPPAEPGAAAVPPDAPLIQR